MPTLVRFLSRVRELVIISSTTVSEHRSTVPASKRFLAGVCAHVHVKPTARRECRVTAIVHAEIWSFPAMYTEVSDQLAGLRARVATDLAHVWFVPGVCPLVVNQRRTLCKGLATPSHVAHVRSIVHMRPLVPVQPTFSSIRLVTAVVITREWAVVWVSSNVGLEFMHRIARHIAAVVLAMI
jgi:hypothetical protein